MRELVQPARVACGAGAVIASIAWFFALGYGVRLLAPLFARPDSWRVRDTAIGAIMVMIALGLWLAYFERGALTTLWRGV